MAIRLLAVFNESGIALALMWLALLGRTVVYAPVLDVIQTTYLQSSLVALALFCRRNAETCVH